MSTWQALADFVQHDVMICCKRQPVENLKNSTLIHASFEQAQELLRLLCLPSLFILQLNLCRPVTAQNESSYLCQSLPGLTEKNQHSLF